MLLQRCFSMPPPPNERLSRDRWKIHHHEKVKKKRDVWHPQLTKIIADFDKHKFINMVPRVGLKIRQMPGVPEKSDEFLLQPGDPKQNLK